MWEVVFNKVGEFQEIVQVNQLTLGGHSSGIYDIAFDVDTSHIATVSKDGTWRLFDTKGKFHDFIFSITSLLMLIVFGRSFSLNYFNLPDVKLSPS